MPKKQTSSRISSQAARLLARLPKRDGSSERGDFIVYVKIPVATLRSLLLSLISQDETRGPTLRKTRTVGKRKGRK